MEKQYFMNLGVTSVSEKFFEINHDGVSQVKKTIIRLGPALNTSGSWEIELFFQRPRNII